MVIKKIILFITLLSLSAYAYAEEKKVNVTFVGNTTMLFSDGETNIMIDGFVTRPSLLKILTKKISSDPTVVKKVLKKLGSPKIDAILVSHSHHDHAMDAPEMAKQTKAVIYGSDSTAEIAYGAHLPEKQMNIIEANKAFDVGKFRVTFIPSKHVTTMSLLGKLTGIGKKILRPLIQPAKYNQFREGGSYSIYIEHPEGSIMLQCSAGYLPHALDNYKADVVFVGIGTLGKTTPEYREDYFKNVADATKATVIFPVHWDFFMQPLEKGLKLMPAPLDQIEQTMDFIKNRYKKRSEKVRYMKLYEKVPLF